MSDGLDWHGSPFDFAAADRIAESLADALFRAAESWPDRPAVVTADRSFSFFDLAGRVAGLAQEIASAAPSPGPVALIQSAGLDAVAAWFACGLAGKPFLLLEPGHPPERQRELVDAAGATLVVCDAGTARGLPDVPGVKRLLPDGRRLAWPAGPGLAADRPAMIFPTSGSTGTPKLVTYSATTLQVKVQASIGLMRVPAGARVLIAGSHGNYGFLHHAMVFLLSGGALCLADVKAGGFRAISEGVLRLGARHVRFTPSLFRAFTCVPEAREALRRLEAVRFSGEPLLRSDLDLARSVLDPGCLIQNVYGSTESALFIWSEGDEIDGEAACVPIGHIYPPSSYALRPLAGGAADTATGELLIRSAHHALGDLKAGTIDRGRLTPCPDDEREQIYATGDVVQRMPGGGLVHLGRLGRMAKIRGHRVFLSEVENHIRALPGATAAAVVEREETGGTVLYGFVTIDEASRSSVDARKWLSARLPDFMIPRRIMEVAQMPLLPGGKVDHHALLALLEDRRADDRPPPRSDIDGPLAEIWARTLGIGALDPQNDFHGLGGDSLKLMELSLEIERHLGRGLPLEAFLADPTLANLSRILGLEERPADAARPEDLRLRSVWPAAAPHRGIALGMPGWAGSALALPFVGAGMFPDHEVWAADFRIGRGNMLEDGRWWRSAFEIAGKLRAGAMPAPRVIFGYSVAGSIAWLVGRMLAGTPQCPNYVVMADSAPMHRIRAYRHRAVDRALAAADPTGRPRVLHVRRKPIESIGYHAGNFGLWTAEDDIAMSIDVPTVDHRDMIQGEILARSAPAARNFLDGGSGAPAVVPATGGGDTPGMRLHRMLDQERKLGDEDLAELLKACIESGSLDCAAGLVNRIIRNNDDSFARAAARRLAIDHPGARVLHYAGYRLARHPRDLIHFDIRALSSRRLAALDRALAVRRPAEPTTFRLAAGTVWKAVDMIRAAVAAETARRRLRMRSPS